MSMQDEQIVDQTTSNEDVQEPVEAIEQQPQESSAPEAVATDTVDESIPEKFAGKSAAEIIQAYRELEKDRGRLASELGTTRKERESMEQRYREIERAASQYQQPTHTQQAPTEQELDPLDVLEAKFDEDPKAAIKEALSLQNKKLLKEKAAKEVDSRKQAASDWYYKQKQENPDYARRESLMTEAASKFSGLVKDEYRNSVEVLQILDLISKGKDTQHYEKQAVERAKKGSLSLRDEKRKAQSESTNSVAGDKTVNVADLSLAQMEKLFGVAQK